MAHPNTGNDTPGFTQLQPVLPRPRNPTTPGDLPVLTGFVGANLLLDAAVGWCPTSLLLHRVGILTAAERSQDRSCVS